ncbi:hypothetical protein FACS189490_05210 [Clostridia bacterium]|nr:hypothetical protein FACS189490_05210 [Clostridia bacterium]
MTSIEHNTETTTVISRNFLFSLNIDFKKYLLSYNVVKYKRLFHID